MSQTDKPSYSDYNKLEALDRKYFNTTQNYTLALLNAFDNIWYYVQERDEENNYLHDKAYKVPVQFGNYEKSVILEDINEFDITTGNINILPRIVISFVSMTKVPERQTQKYQRFSKRVQHPESDRIVLDMSYNSVAYDFQYNMLVQARGMTMATQITEQILKYFNPSMNLNIKEFPIFTDYTQTQIQIEDPQFEIIDEFEDTQVNIINITFGLNVRGNIYSDIGYQGPIEVVDMFLHVWDEFNYNNSKLADYYKFDVNPETPKVKKETIRTYNGTKEYDDSVKLPLDDMQAKRPDFVPPESINIIDQDSEIQK
jgi:hypothetical protein